MRTHAAASTSKFRRLWPLASGITFLNHGSFGACPKKILVLQSELRQQMEAEPVQFLWRRYEERLEPSRRELARFIGARHRDVVFVTNATTGVNAVVRSIRLQPGDEILTTNQDYNACHNALSEVAHGAGARLRLARIPFPIQSPEQVVEVVLRAVTPRTRLAMIDHVTSSTALIFPVAQIIRELEARGVDTLIDGAHAPGMINLNLARLRPTYYTGNLHKWVCAPKGAAFLWVREDKQAALQPAVVSHGNNTHRPGYSEFQDRFDWAGTFDPSAWFCVGEAIRYISELCPGGWKEIRQRNRTLALTARRLLCERLQVEPPAPEEMLGAIATVPLPEAFQHRPKRGKIDTEQLRLYDEFGIEVPFVRIGQPPRRYFRISAQLYNTVADYEYLAESLLRLMA
jgi:isopenicillin-N epimerase